MVDNNTPLVPIPVLEDILRKVNEEQRKVIERYENGRDKD